MKDKDAQHPVITAAEQTGYARTVPKVEIEITTAIQQAFINDDQSAFITFCLENTDAALHYIDAKHPEFMEWLEEVLGSL